MSALVYYLDDQPGISRIKRGRGFSYLAPDGTTIARGLERKRLDSLAVPPAYEEVWISPLHNGHLQATGRDLRRRKQYRYHEKWSEQQSETKFAKLAEFGDALPRIRRQVKRDLDAAPGEREFALASAVLLIDRLSLRVGNPEYTEQNGSYGALTLRNRHVTLRGNRISLNFKAKGGKRVRRQTSDKTLARVLHKACDLDGAEILTWIDDDDAPQTISTGVLNSYLTQIADLDVTAKTFRTWTGSVAAFGIAEKGGATIKAISEAAAEELHNTPAIARTSYIHPDIIALAGEDAPDIEPARKSELSAVEARLLNFLS